MQAVIIRNGDEDVWKMTGETAGVCGVQKYHWEICRKADQTCRPSNACVATLKEMEDVIEARGDEHIWRATGKTAGPC